jgi:hypothetical protein
VAPVHGRNTNSGHPQLDLVDGIDYFKVRLIDTHEDWL